jgi:hypothetical protein
MLVEATDGRFALAIDLPRTRAQFLPLGLAARQRLAAARNAGQPAMKSSRPQPGKASKLAAV